MEKLEINLFDSKADEVAMPGQSIKLDEAEISEQEIKDSLKSTTDVISQGIEGALSGETVKSVLIPEESDIIQPNYVIDFSELGEIEPIQSMAIDALLNEDGDMAVYGYTNGGITKLGMGYSDVLNRVIASAIGNVFNNQCLIYRNYDIGKKLDIVDSKDISHLRLSI